MKARSLVLLLAGVWTAIFVGSFLAIRQVDGPRNPDTGFEKLDMLVLWHLVALCVAIAAALVAWRAPDLSPNIRKIGFAPIGLSLLLVGSFLAAVSFG